MNQTKLVIFDLDNTLYADHSYFRNVFMQYSKSLFSNIDLILNDEFRLKSIDIFGDILKKKNIFTKKKQIDLFFLYKTIKCKLFLYDDAYELIDFLKKKGIKICIITNGNVEVQKNKVKCLGINDLFDKIIYARQWGKIYEKPNPKSFAKALSYFSVKKEDVIFVGDNPDTDIIGASNFGIMGVRFINGHFKKIDCKNDYNIKNLLELKGYIRSLK